MYKNLNPYFSSKNEKKKGSETFMNQYKISSD